MTTSGDNFVLMTTTSFSGGVSGGGATGRIRRGEGDGEGEGEGDGTREWATGGGDWGTVSSGDGGGGGGVLSSSLGFAGRGFDLLGSFFGLIGAGAGAGFGFLVSFSGFIGGGVGFTGSVSG
jgi:hypothetical protein